MDKHRFWKTQPIIDIKTKIEENGVIEEVNLENERKEPYNLPDGYVWSDLDLNNDKDINELKTFLDENYVGDNTSNFRFAYSKESLKWYLQCPNYFPELFISIRLQSSNKIVGTIFGIPLDIKVYDKVIKQVEIDLLCVDMKLREKRLAPVLIKEVTRRTHFRNIFQAVYTANLDLPNKLVTSQYLHRFLNVRKLSEIGFSANKLSISSNEKLFKVIKPKINIRLLQKDDINICLEKLNNKLNNYNLSHIFSKELFEHYFMPRENIIYTYVVENENKITDMISYFIIDKSVFNNKKHTSYKSAYLFYYFNEVTPLEDLLNAAFYFAKESNNDIFNTLNMMELESVNCKFIPGTGYLNYYLYNYKCNPFKTNELALPMF